MRWGTAFGLAGNPPFRRKDKFGIGYFRLSLSKDLLRGLAPLVKLHSEQGIEAYYTVHVGKHLRLTGNAEWVDPTVASAKNALFLGLRAQLSFQSGPAGASAKPTESDETKDASQTPE